MLIGEVAERSGVSARMLRHYDRIGLVSPSARTGGGYRQYRDDDLHRLFHVEALRSLGLSLKEVADALGAGTSTADATLDHVIARTRERIAQEQRLLRVLDRVRTSSPTSWGDVLGTIALMRGLDAASPSSRQRLALTLPQVGTRDLVVLTEAALSESDLVVAGTLYWAIARAGDGAVPLLAAALESPDADRRGRAVAALEKINTPGSRQALAGALGHPDPAVNGRAALAGGTLGHPAAIGVLVAMVVEGRDDIEAADVLGDLADTGCAHDVDRAVAAALAVSSGDARVRLASALCQIPGELARSRLTALAGDSDRRVALAASFALGHPAD